MHGDGRLALDEHCLHGIDDRQRQRGQQFEAKLDPRPGGRRRLALDVIVDGADPQATRHQPAEAGPVRGHGLADGRVRRPVKAQAQPPAAIEEVRVASPQEIEAQVEGGRADTFEHRAPDQAVTAAIDHRHRTAFLIGRREGRMAAQAALHLVVDIRPHRTTDKIGAGGLGRRNHPLEPVRRGNLVVIDHQKMLRGGERRQRGFEGGIDRVAIALARLDHAEA